MTMTTRFHLVGVSLLVWMLVAAPIGAIAQSRASMPASVTTQRATPLDRAKQELAGQQPVFIENRGQWDRRAKFLLRSPGLDLWITDNGVVYDLNRIERTDGQTEQEGPRLQSTAHTEGVIDRKLPELKVTRTPVFIAFEDASRNAVAVGSGMLRQYHNYYIGNDRSKWAEHVPLYNDARVQGVYNGIDAVFYLDNGRPRYDLVVAAGADPSNIRMKIEGASSVSVAKSGALRLTTALGTVEQRELFAYQEAGGSKQKVSCSFVARKDGSVTLKVGRYDRSRALVIDPIIYSTYLGGTGNEVGEGIGVDGSGNAYIVGLTSSAEYPTLNAAQGTYGGNIDAFVTKLTAGGALSYSTFLGGSNYDQGFGVAVDGSGNAYATGWTYETDDFPTLNAFQATSAGYADAFVTKLTSSGTLSYSTYLGGSYGDEGNAIAVDASGNAYITGEVYSPDFPTLNPAQATRGGAAPDVDAFVTKLSSSGALSYSTYIGGSDDDRGNGIGVDGSGNAYVVGGTGSTDFPISNALQGTIAGSSDAFVTKLTASGAFSYSTYLGGAGGELGSGIAVDGGGNAYITGMTSSSDYPALNALQGTFGGGYTDAVVTKITPGGALSYSTYLGGSESEGGYGIAVDGSGNVYTIGHTSSTDFPLLNPVQGTIVAGPDLFMTKLTPSCALAYSTYLGGSGLEIGHGIAVDGSGYVYLTGTTYSTDFPVVNAAQGSYGGNFDALVTKLSLVGSITSVTLGGSSPYCAGSVETISWASSEVSIVDIDFSTDDGATWTSVATGQASGTTGGNYAWTVPASPGSNRRVRVSQTSNSAVSVISDRFTIDLPPSVTGDPLSNAPVCPGTPVVFSAAADGTPTPTIQWQLSTDNGATFNDIGGQTSMSLTISSPTLAMNGYRYHAVFTNHCASVASTAATLHVEDHNAPVPNVASLPTVTVECSTTIGAPAATDNCVGAVTGTTTDPVNYAAQGTYTVHWTYDDGHGNSSTQNQTVIVADVTGPTLTVSLSPTSLWPANNLMRTIAITASAVDNCSAASWVLRSITGNDGATSSDWSYTANTAPSSVQLRAKRTGSGSGRTYTLTFTASDEHGNTTTASRYVTVPHNQGKLVMAESPEGARHGFLSTAVPSPFTTSTDIRFTLPSDGMVTVRIYDALGEEVSLLLQEELKAASHDLIWNGLDAGGRRAPAGEYFYRIESHGTSETGRIVLLR
jgi:hypothetical protein